MPLLTRFATGRALRGLSLCISAVLLTIVARATIDVTLQMQLGNPSSATSDPNNHSHYLIQRPQYALDYDDGTREPNWVGWDLTSGDVGGSGRSSFIQDTTLPAGFYQVLTTDYSGSGYDRGHMCPSADRTITAADNQQVFYMSNMVPQAPDNNQGVWANFESYCRSLASAGNEILIYSGPSGFGGSTIASGVAIPGYTWKIAVVVPLGSGTALTRITSSTRVITIKVPNIAGVRSTPWQNFVTSVAQIEADTGYVFFTALPAPIASALRSEVDGQSTAGAPTITAQPSNQTTVVGGSATFSVTATGDATLTYQWSHGDDDIAGATDATLTLTNVQAADVGAYTVVVTNSLGSATSNSAQLIVTGLPPSITTSPASETVSAGSTITFSVGVMGSPTLTYQWRKNTAPIAGATASTLTLTNVQSSDVANYDVVVTNSVSSATSGAATLTVTPAAPTITSQPSSKAVNTGTNAGLSVGAVGTAPLTYQWRKGGAPISDGGNVTGTTSATLLFSGATPANAGDYDVVVTNGLGFATSTIATLTVNPPPPSTILWNFTTADPTSGLTAEITGGTVTQGNNLGTTALITSTSASGSYTGASGGNNAGAAARVGALNKAASGSAYFEFTLTASAGKRLLASGISFGMRSTSTGPQAFGVFTSLDSFGTAIATGTVPNDGNWHLYTPTFASVTGPTGGSITFRIYGFNGTGTPTSGTANWRMDDLKLTITTVFPPPVPPVVTAVSPANGATAVSISSPITVTFNEAVSFTGSWFTINSALNGPVAATVNGGPTTFTLTPPSFFANNDTITVTILGAQVVDQATGTIPGTGNTTVSFTTEAFVPPTPPTVTTQPVSQTINVGSSATFTVAASGTAPFTYHWRKNGTAISGNGSAFTASLTISGATTADTGSYDCVVANVAGSDVSHTATLTVNVVPPSITTPPAGQALGVGGTATFNVGVGGTAPFTYQWRKDGSPISGATNASLTITGATYASSGAYDVIVTNSAGFATSVAATLAVFDSDPSAIYWDFGTATPTSGVPSGVTGGAFSQGNNNGTTPLLSTTSASTSYVGSSGGNNVGAAARIGALNQGVGGSAYFEFTFTAPAGRQFAATALSFGTRSTGTGPQAFALFSSLDGYATPLAAGTIPNNSAWALYTPTFSGVTTAPGGTVTFRLFGYNGTGSPSANTANWRVDDVKLTAGLLALPPVPPSILTPPTSQTATVGDTVTLTVSATGTAPLSYQWRKDTTPIADNATATTPSLTLSGITSASAANYDCVITNIAGTIVSPAATLTVNKAVATVTLPDLEVTYDGSAHVATAGTTPTGLTVVITYNGDSTAPTNAGAYNVVATIDSPDYTGSASATLTIHPASATVTLSSLGYVYTASPHVATVTTDPAGLSVVVTYDGLALAPVNAGAYTVVATVSDPNYSGSVTGTLTIAKAPAVVALSNLTQTYDGSPKSASASTTPPGLSTVLTYDGGSTAPTNAGSYAVVATIVDGNYVGSVGGTLVIGKATAGVTLGGLNATYSGAPHAVTATTAPAGLTVTFTYDGSATAPTNAGSYAVVGTVVDSNYVGSATGTLVIDKATAGVALAHLQQTYDGSAKVATVATTPAGLTVTVTYDGGSTAPTNAGSYAVAATVVDPNYVGSASGTLVIDPATATITLSDLAQAYDGTPKSVTTTTTPAGLTVDVTYNGDSAAPTAPGSYAVVATIDDPNYNGTASGTLLITTTVVVRHAPAINGGLDGSIQVLLPEAVTLNGNAWISGDLLVSGLPTVVLNGHPTYAGTIDGTGDATPSNFSIALNGSVALRHVVRRTDAISLPTISAPPTPAGTRNVSLNSSSDSAGDFATIRNLTLNGNAGARAIPAGTYGAFTANAHSSFVLGVAGGTTPVVYNLQSLTLNGGATLQVVGPVILNVANSVMLNGGGSGSTATVFGDAEHAEWLVINCAAGGLTVNGNMTVKAFVTAPNGTITLNGSSTLDGSIIADRLTLNAQAVVKSVE
jgi:DNA/RNA endonuclease G (NUC1)